MTETTSDVLDEAARLRERDRWRTAVAVAIALLCGVMLALAPGHSGRTPPGTPYYNAAWLMPVVALVIAGGAALALAVRGLRSGVFRGLATRGDTRPAWLGPVILAVSFGLYIQLTLLIGFLGASLAYILVLFVATGLRRWPYLLLALGLAVALQLIFIDLLDIWMPTPKVDLVAAIWPW